MICSTMESVSTNHEDGVHQSSFTLWEEGREGRSLCYDICMYLPPSQQFLLVKLSVYIVLVKRLNSAPT